MKMEHHRVSLPMSYLLWMVLGLVGAHRFYLFSKHHGSMMILVSIVLLFLGVVGYVNGVTWLMIIPVALWLADGIFMPFLYLASHFFDSVFPLEHSL